MRASSTTLSWPEFVSELTSVGGQWVYRGTLPHWKHETTLERLCRAWGWELGEARELEARLLREFRRHPEARATGVEHDDLADFALMQHHGAPTRLLDWTYSPFVAAFFAFDALFEASKNSRASQHNVSKDHAGCDAAVIWAIDVDWLNERIKRCLGAELWREYWDEKRRPESFRRLFLNPERPIAFVGTANPIEMHARLSIQQGVFLCPGDVSRSWEDNFDAMAGEETDGHVRQFQIPATAMAEAFDGLTRMNVTARSLFPGLDGYAQWMGHRAPLLKRLKLGGSIE